MEFTIKEIKVNESKKDDVPSLCLNMIVKNESMIITRLLESVAPIIDCYCICDTGSTDNTVDLITKYFSKKNIPGKIVYEPFKNFAYNRTFALQSCIGMSDFILLLDADMILEINSFNKESLKYGDTFFILQGSDTFYYQNTRIVKNNGLYKYIGVTHEYVSCPDGNRSVLFKKNTIFIKDIGDGGSKSDKFERDIRLLLAGIGEEPNNARYHFYLANSYKDSGNFDKAIEYYKKRIDLKDWEQEVWYSYYNIGNIYHHQNKMADAIFYWLEAYNKFPLRLENIYKIVEHYRYVGNHNSAKLFYDLAKKTLSQNINKDSFLFLQNDVYTYKFDYEYSIIGCYIGVKNINDAVMSIFNNSDDDNIIRNTLSNMKFYKDRLIPTKVIDLSFSYEQLIGNDKINLNSSSCSILNNKNNSGYILNIRLVNYLITPNGSYLNCEKHIITNNKYVEMDKHLNIKMEKIFDIEYKDARFLGIEDIRIFPNDNNENLIFIGTTQHKNGNIGMVAGDYDTNENIINGVEIKPSFSKESCEKNWAYVKYKNENHLIYKWNPLQICKINDFTNMLDLIETKPNMPKFFKHTRGSTSGVEFNNEFWFILHIVSYETPRHYYHVFAVFDKNMNFLRQSAPFKFEDECIEYCIGLVVEADRVLITYSTWDRTTKLAIYDKSYIDGILIY